MKTNASNVRSIEITVPDTVADGLIDQIVIAVEQLAPADRDEVLDRLTRALACMVGPKSPKYIRP
jgi:hypothetical protein